MKQAQTLLSGNVFTDSHQLPYKSYMLSEWSIELKDRIIPEHVHTIRRLKEYTEEEISDLDVVNWEN